MMNSFRHFRTPVLQLLLLLLFAVFYAGIHFFPHEHLIDGELVVHSHPFTSSAGHEHSSDDASLLFLLSHFSALVALMPFNWSSHWLLMALSLVMVKVTVTAFKYKAAFFLRPPPVKLFDCFC
jgi:hypothetical protein